MHLSYAVNIKSFIKFILMMYKIYINDVESKV